MIKNNKFTMLGLIGSLVFMVSFLIVPAYVGAVTFSPISGNTTLRVGSKGENVKALQAIMASEHDMYPSGIQDGNFGLATKNGVIQFQINYNLTADGIVGSTTRNKINSIISSGQGIDLYAPSINNLTVVTSGTNEIVSFNSNEMVKATVFYDVNSINWNNWDDGVMSLAVPTISGIQSSDSNFSLNKQITLSNLSSNTNYNYTITATDQSGNTSVIWPAKFKTN